MKEKDRRRIEEYVKSLRWTSEDYYWRHPFQVRKFALLIQQKVGGDGEVVEVAALLHDVGKEKLLAPGHEEISAQKTEALLTEMGFNKPKINQVCECIRYEDFRSVEARILRAADSMSLLADDSSGREWYFENVLKKDRKRILREIQKSWSEIDFDFARKMVKGDYERLKEMYS